MRYNLHPLRNLPVGTDPGVLTSNGMSVTGSAVVSLATRENLCGQPFGGDDWVNQGLTTMEQVAVPTSGGLPEGVTDCLHCVGSDHVDAAEYVVALTAGRTYSFSAYVRVASVASSGVELAFFNFGLTETLGVSSRVSSVGGDFVRISVSVTPSSSANYRLRCRQNGGGATEWHVTAVQIEQSLQPRAFHVGSEIVPAWNPLLNGGAGGFDPELQAVRVYRDPGMSHPAAHRVVVAATPGEPLHALTHMWTDDPASIGKTGGIGWNWVRENDSYISSAGGSTTLAAGPKPLTAGGIAPAEAAKAQIFFGLGASGTETNLLYSASQVAPHSIDKYRDEHTRGWRLRNEANRAQGAESIPAPVHRHPTVSIQPYASALGIEANQTSLVFAGEQSEVTA